ncbi:MAG: response regulator [Chloroflexota bacterium]
MMDIHDEHSGHTVDGASGKKRILIVEDHNDTAELLNMILEDEGFEVKRASNATEAFDILSRDCLIPARCPHLVLLDLTMSGKDPVEMVCELDAATLPPMLVVSAKHDTLVESAARRIGAAGIIKKPFDVDDLMASIHHTLDYVAT